MRSITSVLLVFLGVQSMSGQGAFTFFMESTSLEYEEVDLSKNDKSFEFDEGIKNNGDSYLNVGWKISDINGCPTEWDIRVSDKYSDNSIQPNFENSIAIDVAPYEYAPFNVVMFPQGVYGSCLLTVEFFDADNPSKIYDSAQYELKLSGKNTLSRSNTSKESTELFQVYPNPSVNVINIKTESTFESGKIFSSSGQWVKSINANQKEIQIEDLEAGVYQIVLDYTNTTKGTTTFIKIK